MLSYRLYPQAGKPRLALVHSLALDGSIWDNVVQALDGEMEILVYDCRGHGQSEKRAGKYSAQLFAEDLAAVMDACGWERAFLAGCSMGGCVAVAFGAAFPKRTEGLALVDTSAWWGETAPKDWAGRAEAAAKDGLSPMVPLQMGRWFSDEYRKAHPDVIEAITRVFLASDVAVLPVLLRDARSDGPARGGQDSQRPRRHHRRRRGPGHARAYVADACRAYPELDPHDHPQGASPDAD